MFINAFCQLLNNPNNYFINVGNMCQLNGGLLKITPNILTYLPPFISVWLQKTNVSKGSEAKKQLLKITDDIFR